MVATAASIPTYARELRMLTTLLASCDPCGYVDAGMSPTRYAAIALAALRLLERDAAPADLLMVFPDDADAASAARFARVAEDWWRTRREVAGRRVARVIAAF